MENKNLTTTQRHRDHNNSMYEIKLHHQQNARVTYKVELGGLLFFARFSKTGQSFHQS